VDSKLPISNSVTTSLYITCEVNGSVILHAEVTIHDTVPSPNGVTVEDTKLKWSYNLLQPSNLPPDFELDHSFSINYLVHIKHDGVEAVTTVNVSGDRNYLSLDNVTVDTCKIQEFAVQAVINNELYSENSSVASNLSVPVFEYLLAYLQAEERNVFAIQVSFGLRQTQCLLFFTIIIQFETRSIFTFNVTSEDIQNGSASFTLPSNVTGIDVSNGIGVIFGGNEAGNSTTADIQLSNEAIPTSTTTGIPSSTPPHATPSPTPSSSGVPTSTTNQVGATPPTDHNIILCILLCIAVKPVVFILLLEF
jgi:hypothetical protein